MVPKIKRNLTPDEHLKPPPAESYLLVDGFGQPRKIYIKRNVKIVSSQSPSRVQDRRSTIEPASHGEISDYGETHQPFRTVIPQGIQKQPQSLRKNFLLGGAGAESSLICCLSTKSHKDFNKSYHSANS